MAKELPYFKFEASTWFDGDIILEDMEAQGLFINICALYWSKSGNLSLSHVEKRWNKPTALESLLGRFISVSDGFIKIKFLDEQFEERKRLSKTNSKNGSLGGRPKYKGRKAVGLVSVSEKKANESNIEEKRRDINNTNVLFHPLQEWLKKECPRVMKMKEPISLEEAERIVVDFSDKKAIEQVFLAMENKATLLKEYVSANKTFRNWMARNSTQGNKSNNSRALPPGMA